MIKDKSQTIVEIDDDQGRSWDWLCVLGLFSGCAMMGLNASPQAKAWVAPTSDAVEAQLSPEGTVKFVQHGALLHIGGTIKGLQPGQMHSFDFHEVSDCSGDGTANRGQYNSDGVIDDQASSDPQHLGGGFALQADANGVATIEVTVTGLTLNPGPNSIAGRSLVVHREADDPITQPTGHAGPSFGCGLIQPK